MQDGGGRNRRKLDADEILVEQGAAGDELYLLLDGVLSVEVDGDEVAEIGPGAILGELALLEGGRRTATLRARTRCKSPSFRPSWSSDRRWSSSQGGAGARADTPRTRDR